MTFALPVLWLTVAGMQGDFAPRTAAPQTRMLIPVRAEIVQAEIITPRAVNSRYPEVNRQYRLRRKMPLVEFY
jgi:hypothetical protein